VNASAKVRAEMLGHGECKMKTKSSDNARNPMITKNARIERNTPFYFYFNYMDVDCVLKNTP